MKSGALQNLFCKNWYYYSLFPQIECGSILDLPVPIKRPEVTARKLSQKHDPRSTRIQLSFSMDNSSVFYKHCQNSGSVEAGKGSCITEVFCNITNINQRLVII